MKKEDVASTIVYVLMIVFAVIIGFTLVRGMFEQYNKAYGSTFLNPYVFSILTILIGIVVNAVGLELGHVLGGLMGGYTIVSFNVFGFCFYKKDGIRKFQFRDFDGLTGETVLAPKSEKANPKPFVWLPLFMYIIELIACVVLYSISSGADVTTKTPLIWIGTAAIIFITISSMMAIYNFVPVKLDSMTDGYRLTLISKPVNVAAYNELLRIEDLQRRGEPIGEVKVFDEVTNFTASLNLITIYEDLANKDYVEALKLINKMCESSDKISKSTLYRLIAQKLYIIIMTSSLEEAKKYYDEEVNDSIRRFISNDLSMESIRAYVLIAGMLDESIGEVEFANSRKEKAMKRALKSRASTEEELYKDAIKILNEAHKDWNIPELNGFKQYFKVNE